MPIIKVFKTNKSFGVIVPIEIVRNQKIYEGTMFEAVQDGDDRIILERVQIHRHAPTGSIWTVVKA